MNKTNVKFVFSRRNSKKKEKNSRRNFAAFLRENGHRDFGIDDLIAAFLGETDTVMILFLIIFSIGKFQYEAGKLDLHVHVPYPQFSANEINHLSVLCKK